MDHPSAEVRLRFADDSYCLGVPDETTLFFWGSVGFGTHDRSPTAVQDHWEISQRDLFQNCEHRVDCSLAIDGDPKPLLHELRQTDAHQMLGFWTAMDPPPLPVTATVTLETEGVTPSIEGEPVALWTPHHTVIPWGTTVEIEYELYPTESQLPMQTETLWGRHEVYIPLENDTQSATDLQSRL